MPNPAMPEITATLVQNGFELKSADHQEVRFVGPIQYLKREIDIEVVVQQSEMLQFPNIYLVDDIPLEIPRPVPHITAFSKWICYVNPSMAYPDIENPAGSILGAIELAKNLLNDLGRGKLREDLLIEGDVYWSSMQFLIDMGDLPPGKNYYLDAKLVSQKMAPHGWVMQPDNNYPIHLAMNPQEDIQYVGEVILSGYWLNSISPDLPEHRIDNLDQFATWINSYDPLVMHYLRICVQSTIRANKLRLLFNLHTKHHVIGIALIFSEFTDQNNHAWSQPEVKVQPYLPVDISATTWIRRSLPDLHENSQPGLMGQNIVLLGCGSVGGYLADFLAKQGAGQGGGTLTLVDKEELSPSNIGRHILGMDYICGAKTNGMEWELKKKYPGISLKPEFHDSVVIDQHDNFDLIVDATGNIMFSQYLSRLKSQGRIKPNVLFTWVVGYGLGVQTYLQRDGGACLNCVDYRKQGGLFSLIPEGYDIKPRNFSQSCTDWHIPFSIGAVSTCAGLAAEATLKHKDAHQPAFRSIPLQPEAVRIDDGTPIKRKGCLICNTHTG